jgi:hypothetical protein
MLISVDGMNGAGNVLKKMEKRSFFFEVILKEEYRDA